MKPNVVGEPASVRNQFRIHGIVWIVHSHTVGATGRSPLAPHGERR